MYVKMHFSIPETIDRRDAKGSFYTVSDHQHISFAKSLIVIFMIHLGIRNSYQWRSSLLASLSTITFASRETEA